MINLPSPFQIDEEVYLKAVITGVVFNEDGMYYNIRFVDSSGTEDDDNPISNIPAEFIYTSHTPHLKTDKTNE